MVKDTEHFQLPTQSFEVSEYSTLRVVVKLYDRIYF